MRTTWHCILLVPLLVFSTACGEDNPEVGGGSDTSSNTSSDGGDAGNGTTSGSVDSEVSGNKNIQSLDTSQKKKVCVAGQKYILANLSKDVLCRWVAHLLTAFDAPESTEQARETCSSNKSMCTSAERSADEPCSDLSGGGDCSVSVDQWESCEQALADRFIRRARESPQCSEVKLEYYAASDGSESEEETPEACKPLAENCGSFYRKWVGPLKTKVTSN